MEQQPTSRECPYCREDIRADAVKCKHCGSRVSPSQPSHGGTCPYCKEEIHPEAIRCKHCKSWLSDESPEYRACCGGGRSQTLMRLVGSPEQGFGSRFGGPVMHN